MCSVPMFNIRCPYLVYSKYLFFAALGHRTASHGELPDCHTRPPWPVFVVYAVQCVPGEIRPVPGNRRRGRQDWVGLRHLAEQEGGVPSIPRSHRRLHCEHLHGAGSLVPTNRTCGPGEVAGRLGETLRAGFIMLLVSSRVPSQVL